MSSPTPDSRQGELPLAWGAVSESALESALKPPLNTACPEWLSRLRSEDRRRVASLAWEQRPLVFLVDARSRWSLVRPRLPLAGFDALDFRDQPDGDFQIMVPSDTSVRELQHLLGCLRQAHPPRAVACERMAWTGRELAALARQDDGVTALLPSQLRSAEKNS